MSLVGSSVFSQIGNEWINPSNQYLKISVSQDGFYRVFPSDFSNSGFDLTQIDPRSFQLLRRGKDCSIRVTGDQDATFNGTDYVEFYGSKNNGEDEKELFLENAQLNSYYSMYTDTAAYFLTWAGVSGARINSISTQNQVSTSNTLEVKKRNVYTDYYAIGNERSNEVYYSEGDFGEGFVSAGIRNNTSKDFSMNLQDKLPNGDPSKLSILLVGEYSNFRTVNIAITSGAKSLFFTTPQFSSFEDLLYEVNLPNDFLSENLVVTLSPISDINITDFISLAYIELTYNITTDLSPITNNFVFKADKKSRLSLLLPNINSTFYTFNKETDLDEISTPNNWSNDEDFDQYFIFRYNKNDFLRPAKLQRAVFSDQLTPVNYVLISHKKLWSGASAYKQFKESDLGQERIVGLYDIEELYNTYSYGDKNPLAIKRLSKKQLTLGNPKSLMILGKGLTPGFQSGNTYYRKVNYSPLLISDFDFVPTYGMPGSDVCFTQGLLPNPYQQAIPTGRLSVSSNESILTYIEKLKEHALLTYKDTWTKNFLHISGGKNVFEVNTFFENMNALKEKIKGPLVGANTEVFAKKTNLPIELYNISEQVNKGVSMITYLGHSAPNTIEIDIGEASDPTNGYRNKGKYPVLFINGCNSLDIFNSYTRSENWVLAPNRGAIAAFGHSRFGYPNSLYRYTELFYEVAFTDLDFWGATLGEIQNETIKRYSIDDPSNPINYTQIQQWTLMGDPDIRFVAPKKTDFSLDSPISILSKNKNERLTVSSDSAKISFVIANKGIVNTKPLQVCITRYYDNLSKSVQYGPFKVENVGSYTPVEFTFFNGLPKSQGKNLFEVFLDCNSSFDELNEQNNISTLKFEMPSKGVNLLYPYPYAIVGDSKIDFSIESQDRSTLNEEYLFELSKEASFTSVFLKQNVIADNVAMYKNIDLGPIEDSTTFYWRARQKNVAIGEDTIWSSRSFTYIKNKTGWGQFEYDQFKNNELIRINDTGTKLEYDSIQTKLNFSTVGANFTGDFIYNTSLAINDRTVVESLWHPGCTVPGFVLLPLDGASLLSYRGKSASGYSSCGLDPKTTAHFVADNAQHMSNMQSYLESIPVGDYLILLSTSNNLIENVPVNVLDKLHEFGCFTLETLKNGTPYLFVGKKGSALPMFESFDLDKSKKIEQTYVIKDFASSGEIKAKEISVATSWDAFSWSFLGVNTEKFSTDLFSDTKNVYASNAFKNSVPSGDIIDLNKETSLNLSAVFTDKSLKTLSELDHWALFYTISPEGVVLPAATSGTNRIKYNQGDAIVVKAAFLNVSTVDFDTLQVGVKVKDAVGNILIDKQIKTSPLKAKDTLFFDYSFANKSLVGNVIIEFNFNQSQLLEQYLGNNNYTQMIAIAKDEVAPLTYLNLNGVVPIKDALSTNNPIIQIFIYDDNKNFPKNDTLGIEMYLSGPCEDFNNCLLKRVYFSQKGLVWSRNKDFLEIDLPFYALEQGKYEFKVFGADAYGNINEKATSITFEVQETTSLSAFLPYPSPFSSQMRFAYQMKGSKQPQKMNVQIVNTNGNLVCELTEKELGPLTPGSNLTSWSWDGTDRFGNQLPNGIYLYRCTILDNEIVEMKTEADRLFKDGWGSIMIAR